MVLVLPPPCGLKDEALADIAGPEGQAFLAAAPAPPERWDDWTREPDAVLLGAAGFDPNRGMTRGGRAINNTALSAPGRRRRLPCSTAGPELVLY